MNPDKELYHQRADISKQISKEVSERSGLNSVQVMQIADFQFEFLRGIMQDNTLRAVRFPYLGIFQVSVFKLNKIHEHAAFRRLKRQSSTDTGSEVSTGDQEDNSEIEG